MLELLKRAQPELVPHKCKLTVSVARSVSILNVEKISAPNERLFVPPISIHSVNCHRLFLSVYCDSFVESLLIYS